MDATTLPPGGSIPWVDRDAEGAAAKDAAKTAYKTGELLVASSAAAGFKAAHPRGPHKRSACVICKQNAVEKGRGISGQQRRILHDLSANIVSRSLDRHISRPRTGCLSCNVALCTTGGCWEAFHSVVVGS